MNVSVRDGRLLVYDHGDGTTQDTLLAALNERGLWPQGSPASSAPPATPGVPGLSGLSAIPPPSSPAPNGAPTERSVRRWHIRAPDGQVVVHVRRDPGKHLHWERADGQLGLSGISPRDLLYEPEPLGAHPGEEVTYVEGESAADAVWAAGKLAAASVCGAPTVPSETALGRLIGHPVVLWADNDEAGRKQMAGSAQVLAKIGCTRLRQVVWPEAPDHGDAADASPALILRLITDATPLPTDQAAHHAPGKDDFFSHDGFAPKRVIDYLETECPIRLGEDGRLYRYVGGVHLADGERWVLSRVLELLDERCKRRHLEETKALLWARLPSLPIEPPREFLNLPNGLLDWSTGELHEHSPNISSMIRIPVAWSPKATCPKIHKFLSEVLPDDVVPMIYELFGYALYAGNPFQRAVLLLGKGGNGKGQLLRLFRALCGGRNCSALSLHQLSEERFLLAELYGRLVNVCGDLDARQVERSDIFKQVTGGDVVTAERKFGHPFVFLPFALPIFSANEAPFSADQTPAYFDRWIVIPMSRRFRDTPAEVSDLGLKLAANPAEMEGLLVRAVESLQQLMKRGGFETPDSVREAGKKYREELDSVLAFVKDRCRFSSSFWTERTRFYNAYKAYCLDNGRQPLSSRNVYAKLREMAREVKRSD